jgi:hypothetical protein
VKTSSNPNIESVPCGSEHHRRWRDGIDSATSPNSLSWHIQEQIQCLSDIHHRQSSRSERGQLEAIGLEGRTKDLK